MGCEMKDYKRLTERDDSLCIDCADIGFCRKTCIRQARYERLQFLENEIESGELVDRNSYLDYLLAAKNTLELTDKEIEFFAKHNASVREDTDAEIARLTAENQRLTAENASLRARLDNAVELPRLEISPYDSNDTLLYYLENGHIQQECFNNKYPEQLQKRLAELKGGRCK